MITSKTTTRTRVAFVVAVIVRITVISQLTLLITNHHHQVHVEAGIGSKLKSFGSNEYRNWVHELKAQDACGAVFTSKIHGYDVKKYELTTKDNYILTLHRLIHPSDIADGGPKIKAKKPYLLLHGLVGTSASYVININPDYQAPADIMDINPSINEHLWSKANEFEFSWQSTADHFDLMPSGEKNDNKWKRGRKKSAHLEEIDFDSDSIQFAREFKQSNRKFNLSKQSKNHVVSSLAFTLSNFGYDVWMLNLRGNDYSRKFSGRYTTEFAEYWDFDIETLAREDLLASINLVAKKTQWPGPMGFVSYSYTSAHVLNLLTSYPSYQETLQPIVMIAPSLLTATPERSKLRHVVKFVANLFVSNNGPFPAIGRVEEDRIEKLICHLPLASKLCGLLETILHGKPKSLTNLVFDDKQTALVRQDSSCSQTSKQVLHQLIKNLSRAEIHPKFSPFTKARIKAMGGQAVRRSVMLFHSKGDSVATMNDVVKIRDSALRLLALSDYVIDDNHFGHTDFLFGEKNRYLLNAEIVRQVRLFDFMIMYSTPNLQPFGSTRYKNVKKSPSKSKDNSTVSSMS